MLQKMKRGLGIILLCGLLSSLDLEAGAQPNKARTRTVGDIEVILFFANGNKLIYTSEVRRLQIVLDGTGKISMVHLVLAKGAETDTHEWFNFKNLAGFSYKYLSITGRGKVAVVRSKEVPGQSAVPDKVPVLRPENYL